MVLSPAISQSETEHETSDYQQGVEAYAAGDYQRAANIWLIEAYEGSADAQFNLGVMYIEGRGMEQSRDEAIFWFTKAARSGHFEAQYNLGHLFLEEKEDPDKVRQGIDWWRQSAESGFAIAQFNYGRALYFGIGVDQDRGKARVWLEKAAAVGEQRARQFLQSNAGTFGLAAATVAQQPVGAGNSTSTRNATGASDTTIADSDSQQAVQKSAAASGRQVVSNANDAAQTGESVAIEVAADQPIYVLVRERSTLAYAQFNTRAPVIGRIKAKTLLRVVSINDSWLQVQAPGGFPGWIKRNQLVLKNGIVEVSVGQAQIYTGPTEQSGNNVIGELPRGIRMLLLEEQENWVRVQGPEQMPGWIESQFVNKVKAPAEKIAAIWQVQGLKQKLAAMPPVESTYQNLDEPRILIPGVQIKAKFDSFNRQIVEQQLYQGQSAKYAGNAPEMELTASRFQGEQSERGAEALTVDEFVKLQGQAVSINPESTSVVSHTPANKTQQPQQEQIQRVRRTGVQLVSSPGSHSIALFNIAQGTLVDIITRQAQWARVSIPGGLPVWVPAAQVEVNSGTVTVTDARVRVRAVPGDREDIPVLGLIGQGMKLQLLDNPGQWIRVLAPEWITAWISLEDIELIKGQDGLQQEWQQQKTKFLAHLKREG